MSRRKSVTSFLVGAFAPPPDDRQVGPLLTGDSSLPDQIQCSDVVGYRRNAGDSPGHDPDGEKYGGIRKVEAKEIRYGYDPMWTHNHSSDDLDD